MFRLKIVFKVRCFFYKMIVFFIFIFCFLKLVVKRLREVRELLVCNKVVIVFNNFFLVILLKGGIFNNFRLCFRNRFI